MWPDRKEEPGAIHHVMTRGVDRMDIFVDDRCREKFLWLLAKVIERHGWICHGFTLMDNHYHLLIQTPEANLGKGMQVLNGSYAQWFNGYVGRRGHLFECRYRSVRIVRQAHLLESCRYIVLNRVRAGACPAVEDWLWSSYHATAGRLRRPPWLTVGWLLGQFGGSRSRYRAFVAEGSPYASLDGILAS